MNRSTTHFSTTLLLVIGVFAGCAIDGPRAGIGAVCVPGDDVCPLDHICLADDDTQASGLCAPVLDYGSCDAPGYPQRDGEVRDESLEIDVVGDLDFLDETIRIEGDLTIKPPAAGQTLVLGDICKTSSLQHVTGSVLVSSTDLTNLDGLQGLSVVGAGIGIAGNRNLVDLKGLQNLITLGARANDNFNVVIADNATLPEAEILALRATLEARHSTAIFVICGNTRGGRANTDKDCPNSINALLRR